MKKNAESDGTNKVKKNDDSWRIEATGYNKFYSIAKYYGDYVNKQISLFEQTKTTHLDIGLALIIPPHT